MRVVVTKSIVKHIRKQTEPYGGLTRDCGGSYAYDTRVLGMNWLPILFRSDLHAFFYDWHTMRKGADVVGKVCGPSRSVKEEILSES